ncbi:MAG: sigma 54-interacting transcriptional regulator [Myxococcota bacterium]
MASTSRTTGLSGAAAAVARPQEPAPSSRAAGRRREDRLVGPSEATRHLIAQAAAASRTDLMVWVVGPSGADHPLVARAVHEWGPRAGRSLEVVACSAVPEALQGREVFGCAEGVYPAVPGAYVGALERAGGGTLVLEDLEALHPEVGEWGIPEAIKERVRIHARYESYIERQRSEVERMRRLESWRIPAGLDPEVAARSGAYWHGVAGAELQSRQTLTADALVDQLAVTTRRL